MTDYRQSAAEFADQIIKGKEDERRMDIPPGALMLRVHKGAPNLFMAVSKNHDENPSPLWKMRDKVHPAVLKEYDMTAITAEELLNDIASDNRAVDIYLAKDKPTMDKLQEIIEKMPEDSRPSLMLVDANDGKFFTEDLEVNRDAVTITPDDVRRNYNPDQDRSRALYNAIDKTPFKGKIQPSSFITYPFSNTVMARECPYDDSRVDLITGSKAVITTFADKAIKFPVYHYEYGRKIKSDGFAANISKEEYEKLPVQKIGVFITEKTGDEREPYKEKPQERNIVDLTRNMLQKGDRACAEELREIEERIHEAQQNNDEFEELRLESKRVGKDVPPLLVLDRIAPNLSVEEIQNGLEDYQSAFEFDWEDPDCKIGDYDMNLNKLLYETGNKPYSNNIEHMFRELLQYQPEAERNEIENDGWDNSIIT